MQIEENTIGMYNSYSNFEVGSSNPIQIEYNTTRDSNHSGPLLDSDPYPHVKPPLQSSNTKPISITYSRHAKRKIVVTDPQIEVNSNNFLAI